MEQTDVAIIGAGPNGLALASHLEEVGVERVVLGRLLSSWRDHMPRGMLLKSEPYGSDIASPQPAMHVRDYCLRRGIEYEDRSLPLKVETFLEYADWYARRLVPDVRDLRVVDVNVVSGGYRLNTAEGSGLLARRVVVATGLMPFVYLPPPLDGLPTDLVTHAWAHGDLSRFRGMKVGVVGAGQSALESAALIHELGGEVELIARTPELEFAEPNPEPGGRWSSLRRPVTKTGEGWVCWCYHCLPDAFRSMPKAWRVDKGIGFLGPAGAWWLKPRVVGQVPLRTGVEIRGARQEGSRLRLVLEGDHGGVADYDHVIAGTGYRLDTSRLDFLSSEIRARLDVVGGAPQLSRGFESSVPGLFFVGAMAAPSLGPSTRFVSGTHFTARRLTRRLSHGRRLRTGDEIRQETAGAVALRETG